MKNIYKQFYKYKGFTLLEVILVLAIGSALLVAGLRQYQLYRADLDLQLIQSNVDNLFQAATLYYYANCRNQWNPSGGYLVRFGNLDPRNGLTPTDGGSATISISLLRSDHYLTTSLYYAPIIRSSPQGEGYSVKFLRKDSQRMIKLSDGNEVSGGTVVNWRIQVAAKLSDSKKGKTYASMLGADCGPNCSYLIWTRLPSLYSIAAAQSSLWIMNPTATQFTQMYTTFPILMLTNEVKTNEQYYLCGS